MWRVTDPSWLRSNREIIPPHSTCICRWIHRNILTPAENPWSYLGPPVFSLAVECQLQKWCSALGNLTWGAIDLMKHRTRQNFWPLLPLPSRSRGPLGSRRSLCPRVPFLSQQDSCRALRGAGPLCLHFPVRFLWEKCSSGWQMLARGLELQFPPSVHQGPGLQPHSHIPQAREGYWPGRKRWPQTWLSMSFLWEKITCSQVSLILN